MIKIAVYLFIVALAAVQGDKKPSAPHLHVGLDGDLYIKTKDGKVGKRLISEVISRYEFPDKTVLFASRNSLVAVNDAVQVDFYGKFTATIPERINVTIEPVSEMRLRLRLSTGGRETRLITLTIGENEITSELRPLLDVTFEIIRTTDAGKVMIETDRKRFDVTNKKVVLKSSEYTPPSLKAEEPAKTPTGTGASIVRTVIGTAADTFSSFKVASPTQPE